MIIPNVKKSFHILKSSRQLPKLQNKRRSVSVLDLNLKVRLCFNRFEVGDCIEIHSARSTAPLKFSSENPSISTQSVRVPRIFRLSHNHSMVPVKIFSVGSVKATSKIRMSWLLIKVFAKIGNHPLKSQAVIGFWNFLGKTIEILFFLPNVVFSQTIHADRRFF